MEIVYMIETVATVIFGAVILGACLGGYVLAAIAAGAAARARAEADYWQVCLTMANEIARQELDRAHYWRARAVTVGAADVSDVWRAAIEGLDL